MHCVQVAVVLVPTRIFDIVLRKCARRGSLVALGTALIGTGGEMGPRVVGMIGLMP